MPTIDLDHVTLHYELSGPPAGPVVMLSHSLGCTLSMWDQQAAVLSERWRVLSYDLRGHGRSAVPPGPYTIEQLADDAAALIDALGVAPVHFCGLSIGGLIGQSLALRHGGRLLSLALCATTCRLSPPELWAERAAIARGQGMAALVDAVLARWFTAGFRASAPAAIEPVRRMLLDTAPEGYAGCCEAIREADLCGRLGAVGLPTVVIAGAEDPAVTPAMARRLAAAIPGAGYHELADAAHLINVEQPEVFNRALTRFLQRQE
jgi:3-oxoadipate enol-lactonase